MTMANLPELKLPECKHATMSAGETVTMALALPRCTFCERDALRKVAESASAYRRAVQGARNYDPTMAMISYGAELDDAFRALDALGGREGKPVADPA